MGKILEFENNKKEKLRIFINDMNIITKIKIIDDNNKFLNQFQDLAILSKEKNIKLTKFLNYFYKYCSEKQINKINNIIEKYRN